MLGSELPVTSITSRGMEQYFECMGVAEYLIKVRTTVLYLSDIAIDMVEVKVQWGKV